MEYTSSSNLTTLPCAFVRAASNISMCVLCSCKVALWAASSISCLSLAATSSLSKQSDISLYRKLIYIDRKNLLWVISCEIRTSRLLSSFRRFTIPDPSVVGDLDKAWLWKKSICSLRVRFWSCNLRFSFCSRTLAAFSNLSRLSQVCTSSSCALWTFNTSCSNCIGEI